MSDVAAQAPQCLCELCFENLTTHMTTAWDGLEMAVCEDCLAPPVDDPAWEWLWHPAVLAQMQPYRPLAQLMSILGRQRIYEPIPDVPPAPLEPPLRGRSASQIVFDEFGGHWDVAREQAAFTRVEIECLDPFHSFSPAVYEVLMQATPATTFYLLAGSFREAAWWQDRLQRPCRPHWQILTHPYHLHGLRHPIVFCGGTYHQRRDWPEIQRALGALHAHVIELRDF